MSTRSGKRIHISRESPVMDSDILLESGRKTRSKKQKENIECSANKKHNYVTYPDAEENITHVCSNAVEPNYKAKKKGKTQGNTLKEQNRDDNKNIKKSRRGWKLTEEHENDDIENHKNTSVTDDKRKKIKKKELKKNYVEITDNTEGNKKQTIKKKGKRRKKINSFVISDQEMEQIGNNVSVDSFHSAAGSPVNNEVFITNNKAVVLTNLVELETKDEILKSHTLIPSSITMDVLVRKKKQSNVKNSLDVIDTEDIKCLNSTFDKSPNLLFISNPIMDSVTKNKRKSNSNKRNSAFDKTETKNANEDLVNKTYDKIADVSTTLNNIVDSIKNVTNDHIEIDSVQENKLNTTFEKEDDVQKTFNMTANGQMTKKLNLKNATNHKVKTNETKVTKESCFANQYLTENNNKHDPIDSQNTDDSVLVRNNKRKSSIVNFTFDKVQSDVDENEPKDVNCIFDKNYNNSGSQNFILDKTASKRKSKIKTLENKENIKLNATFDDEKNSEVFCDSRKPSLNNSPALINVTFDKSGDNSHISITNDESKTENILNHTIVLIESSIDESLISEDKKPEKTEIPLIPLKREGTFTKENPDITPPKPKSFSEQTVGKYTSSPGCTPHPFSKRPQKEKTILNVTRSIEKSLRRSSLVETGSRQTRVMFCSPVNNTTMGSEMKGKVIKSSLKGSNKCFIFEDNATSELRRDRRKRSLTVGEGETRAKRKRLVDELQHSVDRLSRPRTLSAAAKLPDAGAVLKKCGTPSKMKPETKMFRTKLPNFAALHQKQFAKMESLDECQERKAKRAKQLLTPTGSVSLLERISPKDTDTPKPAPPAKEPVSKLYTPSKTKLPTLSSLNPGYTRFGFKLNMDVNPFNVTRKIEKKENRPNGVSRQATCAALPSLAGATARRRDVAKQVVMREKSFTDRRDLKRKESRTVIKGVRTNRRFELQMKLRNL